MLFDIPEPQPALVGIARLASQSPLLEAKHRVEYFQIEARSFVGRCSGTRMPFVWTVNPYRGCEFGCKYCYARYAHEFMELRDPQQFERKIYAKRFNAASFGAELTKVKSGESVWIGTATDPYQPAERRYGITRRILEVIAKERGLDIGITTKSDLAGRDADLLKTIAENNHVHVHMTVTTTNERLARLVEPMAPRPELRFDAIRKLADRGIGVTVLANPVMPFITDSAENLDAVCAAAAKAGAVSFSGHALFLKPCSKAVFLPFVEQRFPHLAAKYRQIYAANAYLKGAYPEIVAERVKAAVAKHGLVERRLAYRAEHFAEQPQLSLW
jgi:DNA repair photolyase